MIKNQLYPYLEKYINEYLHGFSKEQLNVGVMSGTIVLDGINIKPDRVNEKLDVIDVPIWLKAGMIKKIRIACSLMNFIGEKPLEVLIEDIVCIITPSFKWIIKNLSTFIEENEFHIKECYDAMDNNSHDIFNKKVNIYDSSSIRLKRKIYEMFTDKSNISEILNNVVTQILKFYYQKPYMINVKVKNIHFRFEDDQLLNYFTDIGIGVQLSNLELNLTAEGVTKRNIFKFENLNIYWEPQPLIIIPSKKFLECIDKESNINQKYYEYLNSLNINDRLKKLNHVLILENFNCMGNIGIQNIESGNLDFFAKDRQKNYKFIMQLATSEINLNIYPDVFKISERIADFMRNFFIIDSIQDFKPMRKPYNKLSELVKKFKNDGKFSYKRKMVVRDWFYYLLWSNRFKKAIYGNAFNNSLQSEFSKYFNICCLPSYFEKNIDQSQASVINDNIDTKKESNNNVENKELNFNPENINLIIQSEFLIKGVNISINLTTEEKINDTILVKLSGLELKIIIKKEKFDLKFEIKNMNLSSKNKISILKSIEDNILEEINGSSTSNNNKENIEVTNNNHIKSNNLKNCNQDNESFSSEFGMFSPTSQITDDNISLNNNNVSKFSGTTFTNPKLIKKLSVLNEALDKMSNRGDYDLKSNYTTQTKNQLNQSKKFDFLHTILGDESDYNSRENTNIRAKNNNLSKMINDYNKTIIKNKNTLPIKQSQIIKLTEINDKVSQPKIEDKISLNIIDIFSIKNSKLDSAIPNNPNTPPCVSIKIFKNFSNISNNETISFNLGTIRLNYLTEYVCSLFSIMTCYPIIQKIKIINNKKASDKSILINNVKELLDLKKLISNKLSNFATKKKRNSQISKQIPSDILEYTSYIKHELESCDNELIDNCKNHNFYINCLFSFFKNKNIEVNFNYSNFYLLIYTPNQNSNVIVSNTLKVNKNTVSSRNDNISISGKFKLPNLNFKLIINSLQNLYFKFLDLEMNFSELETLKCTMEILMSAITDKFSSYYNIIVPVMKKLYEENKEIINNDVKLKIIDHKSPNNNKNGNNYIIKNNEKKINGDKLENHKLPYENSLMESNNTCYVDSSIFKEDFTNMNVKNKDLKNINKNNSDYNEKSLENISDFDDFGISMDNSINIKTNIKKIQNFNKVDTVTHQTLSKQKKEKLKEKVKDFLN